MGIFSAIISIITAPFRFIFGLFRGKKKNELEIPSLPEKPALQPQTQPELTEIQKTTTDIVRVKLDLVLTELDSLKTINQMLTRRLEAIEKKLDEKERIRYF